MLKCTDCWQFREYVNREGLELLRDDIIFINSKLLRCINTLLQKNILLNFIDNYEFFDENTGREHPIVNDSCEKNSKLLRCINTLLQPKVAMSLEILKKYCYEYKSGMDECCSDVRKQNAGRFRANSFLRKMAEILGDFNHS